MSKHAYAERRVKRRPSASHLPLYKNVDAYLGQVALARSAASRPVGSPEPQDADPGSALEQRLFSSPSAGCESPQGGSYPAIDERFFLPLGAYIMQKISGMKKNTLRSHLSSRTNEQHRKAVPDRKNRFMKTLRKEMGRALAGSVEATPVANEMKYGLSGPSIEERIAHLLETASSRKVAAHVGRAFYEGSRRYHEQVKDTRFDCWQEYNEIIQRI